MFCWSHDSLTFAEKVLAGIFWYYEYSEHFLSLSHLFTHAGSYLYPSFQGLMSDNDTVRLGLDFQRMLRINHMLYIAARSVISPEPLVYVCKVFKATVRLPTDFQRFDRGMERCDSTSYHTFLRFGHYLLT